MKTECIIDALVNECQLLQNNNSAKPTESAKLHFEL